MKTNSKQNLKFSHFRFCRKKNYNNLSRRDHEAILALKKNTNLVIKNTEKGGELIIMYKTSYDLKLKIIFNNEN